MKSRLIPFLLLSAIIYIIALYTGSPVYYFVIWLLAFIFIFSIISLFILKKRIEIKTKTPFLTCERGGTGEMKIIVKNPTVIPLFRSQIKGNFENIDENSPDKVILYLPVKGSASITIPLSFQHCGEYEYGFSEVKISDPFGLFVTRLKGVSSIKKIYSTPTIIPVQNYISPAQSGRKAIPIMKKTKEREELSEIHSFGEDDYVRNIHWKQSARRGELMAASYETPKNDELLLFIDCGMVNPTNNKEQLLSLGDFAGDYARSFAEKAVKKNQSIKVIIFREDDSPREFIISSKVGTNALIAFSSLSPVKRGNVTKHHFLPYLPLAYQYANCALICFEYTNVTDMQVVKFIDNRVSFSVFRVVDEKGKIGIRE